MWEPKIHSPNGELIYSSFIVLVEGGISSITCWIVKVKKSTSKAFGSTILSGYLFGEIGVLRDIASWFQTIWTGWARQTLPSSCSTRTEMDLSPGLSFLRWSLLVGCISSEPVDNCIVWMGGYPSLCIYICTWSAISNLGFKEDDKRANRCHFREVWQQRRREDEQEGVQAADGIEQEGRSGRAAESNMSQRK